VGLLLLTNTVSIAADLSVMGDALQRLVGGPRLLWVALFGLGCALLQVFLCYTRYVAVLKWTTLSLLAYVAALLIVDIPWGEVVRSVVAPPVALEARYVTMIVAILGVALSPYVLFWQASQEVEDQRVKPRREPLVEAPEQAPAALERIRLDTYLGMAVANLVGAAIMLTTAATLHAQGVRDVTSSAQVAEALRPVAGDLAFAVFALGIIGTGLLAVPVLAGSAAYAIGEARRWPVGLSRAPLEAKAFYGTIAAALLAGVAANLLGLDPLQALYGSAVLSGVVAAPVLAVMLRLACRPEVMGDLVISRGLRIGGWIAVVVVALCILASAGSLVLGW
jgi:Mn2+/Fe2+ NRAMP family transporter